MAIDRTQSAHSIPHCILVKTDGKITLSTPNGSQYILGNLAHEVYRAGAWLIDSFWQTDAGQAGTRSYQIFPQVFAQDADVLTMEFEVRPVTLSLLARENGTEKTFSGVEKMLLHPQKGVNILPNRREAPSGGRVPATRETPSGSAQSPPPKKREEVSPGNPTDGGTVRALQARVSLLQTMITHLSSQPVGSMLAELRSNRDALSGQLRASMEEAELLEVRAQEARILLDETQGRIQVKKQELETLREQLRQAGNQEELYELDCRKAREQLDGLRLRVESNEDAVQLLEMDPFLKEQSIKKTMENVGREMDAVERRLGLIIRFQEAFQKKVRRSILKGDGQISTGEESGEG